MGKKMSKLNSGNNDKQVDVSQLNDDELNTYATERLDKYKITIAVCIIYGILALLLLLLALFTEWGKRVLYDKMAAFVFTYIIGTIIIIIYLANEIYNFKPKKMDNSLGYDTHMCPDYWKLQNMTDDEFVDKKGDKFFNSDVNPNHFRYKCVLDDNIFTKNKFKDLDKSKSSVNKKNYIISDKNNLYVKVNNKSMTGINDDEQYESFKKMAANMNGYTYKNGSLKKNNELSINGPGLDGNSIPLSCDNVYPLYLSVYDNDNVKNNSSEPSNKYRCAYAKSCGIAWTEAGCS